MRPLGVTMAIRDFKVCKYWLDTLNIDRLMVENYVHEEAHRIAKEFFLKHAEYTHFIFLTEDIIVTQPYLDLIIKDAVENPDAVVCGYSNVRFDRDEANISFRDLSKVNVMFREQYMHPKIEDVAKGVYGYPLIRVFFQGNTLACYPRHVVEKLSFKPYKYLSPAQSYQMFRLNMPHGIMFDLQMCIEMHKMNIPVLCDVRCFCPHMFEMPNWDLRNRKRRVILKRGNEERVIREDAPYS